MVIKRMTRDLNWNIDIKIAPTVREHDGLAMSSRNANLTTLERSNATKLYKGLCKGQTEIPKGVRSAKKIQQII